MSAVVAANCLTDSDKNYLREMSGKKMTVKHLNWTQATRTQHNTLDENIQSMLRETQNCLNCGNRLKRGHGFKIKAGYCSSYCYLEKPPKMAYLEKEYGKPIREVMIDILNKSNTMEPVAGLMGIGKPTLYNWIKKLKIQQTVIWK
jgi:hypothetical protein